VCADAPEVLVQELLVFFDDRHKMVGGAAPGHEGQEGAHQLREPRPLRALRRHRPLRHRRNPRPGEEVAQVKVALEPRRHVTELTAGELGLAALLREHKERLRIQRSRPPSLQRLAPGFSACGLGLTPRGYRSVRGCRTASVGACARRPRGPPVRCCLVASSKTRTPRRAPWMSWPSRPPGCR
jgi:hypothetical protein